MTAYSEKLKDPRWQKKRLEILNRDGWRCQYCFDNESTLHVHHLEYSAGKEPWEYEGASLLTICEICHTQEHEFRSEAEKDLLKSLKSSRVSWLGIRLLSEKLNVAVHSENTQHLIPDALFLFRQIIDCAEGKIHENLKLAFSVFGLKMSDDEDLNALG